MTVTNTGGSPLTFSAITASGDFALDSAGTTCSTEAALAPAETCTIAVTFTPTAAGTRTGAITINDDAAGGTQVIALSGTGLQQTGGGNNGGNGSSGGGGAIDAWSLALLLLLLPAALRRRRRTWLSRNWPLRLKHPGPAIAQY